jgi:hypothetical protein
MDKKNPSAGVAIVNRSDRRKAHKPVKAESPIGVPSVGASPVMVESVDQTETIKATEPESTEPTIEELKAAIVALTSDRDMYRASAEKAWSDYKTEVDRMINERRATDGEVSAIERNILRRLFTGDKGARSIMLDVVTDLANSPDRDGNVFPTDRDTVGARIPKGLLQGILRIAKDERDETHPAFALGASIGGKAVVKAGAAKDDKALTETLQLLDLSRALPNLVAGMREMVEHAHESTGSMKRRGLNKAPAMNANAGERLTVVDKALQGDKGAIGDYLHEKGKKGKAKKTA